MPSMSKHKSTSETASTKPGQPVEIGAAQIDADRLAQLRVLIPEAFDESGINFDKLKLALGGAVEEGKERYGLTWSGKAQSVRQLMLPSRATLVPDVKESINFDTTQHVFIEGENLEVLKLLRKAYAGRVKMIYIDPPYNTGKDFIYPDNFADPLGDYLKKTGQVDEEGNWTSSVTDADGRKHSKWLSMIYPRLLAARDLLREDGVIFVSIDDHEVHNLRMVMNEVFGEENFVATVVWQKMYSPANDAKGIDAMHDYIICFARSAEVAIGLFPRTEKQDSAYTNPDKDPRGPWKGVDPTRAEHRDYAFFPIKTPSGRTVWPAKGRSWGFRKEELPELLRDNLLWFGEDGSAKPAMKRFLDKVKQGVVPVTWWPHADAGHNDAAKKELKALLDDSVPFDTPKPVALLRRMLTIATSDLGGDIVLDFFAGSGTLGQAVIEHNASDGGSRRFVGVQLAEPVPSAEHGGSTIAEISRRRLKAAAERLEAKASATLRGSGQLDLGFRAFRITQSHYKRWAGTTDQDVAKYIETMALYTDPLLPGWTPEGLLWEVALKAGYPLHSIVETLKEIKGQTVYRVTDPDKGTSFLACFDKAIAKDLAGRLKLTREDTFVVRDAALDDTLAANLALTCTLRTI